MSDELDPVIESPAWWDAPYRPYFKSRDKLSWARGRRRLTVQRRQGMRGIVVDPNRYQAVLGRARGWTRRAPISPADHWLQRSGYPEYPF